MDDLDGLPRANYIDKYGNNNYYAITRIISEKGSIEFIGKGLGEDNWGEDSGFVMEDLDTYTVCEIADFLKNY